MIEPIDIYGLKKNSSEAILGAAHMGRTSNKNLTRMGQVLDRLIAEAGFPSHRAFALEAGVSTSNLGRTLYESKNLQSRTVIKYARALSLDVDALRRELTVIAGGQEAPAAPVDSLAQTPLSEAPTLEELQQELCEAFPEFNATDKKVVSEIIRKFRRKSA